jgi:hypothetical protein
MQQHDVATPVHHPARVAPSLPTSRPPPASQLFGHTCDSFQSREMPHFWSRVSTPQTAAEIVMHPSHHPARSPKNSTSSSRTG